MVRLGISDKLELAVMKTSQRLSTIKPRSNWAQCSENSLWYELIACMLGSMVSFEHAQVAVDYLNTKGLLDVANHLRDPREFELRVFEALSSPIYPPVTRSGDGRKYRYPKLRANHIRRTAESIYQAGGSIRNLLNSGKSSRDTRVRIMGTAVGVGPKQASLFLRNIGYAVDLAILDRHVLRYMFLLGFLPTKIRGVTSLRAYVEIEDKLRNYAKRVRIDLSSLDTVIWVVMRVFRKEFAQ